MPPDWWDDEVDRRFDLGYRTESEEIAAAARRAPLTADIVVWLRARLRVRHAMSGALPFNQGCCAALGDALQRCLS